MRTVFVVRFVIDLVRGWFAAAAAVGKGMTRGRLNCTGADFRG